MLYQIYDIANKSQQIDGIENIKKSIKNNNGVIPKSLLNGLEYEIIPNYNLYGGGGINKLYPKIILIKQGSNYYKLTNIKELNNKYIKVGRFSKEYNVTIFNHVYKNYLKKMYV
ncbi:hypothetical protein [Vallitalea guaymasensis]|uniref:hypothetical protein n=1 Tax=Vallitalea guaymasensis TaxID=1185412 RepID=UPI000DE433C5|nr:hypothetical protein [Vallitalea guaymasensis]